MRHRAETAMRELLAAAQMDFAVTRESLSFVAYTDPQLPPDNTQAWSVSDARVTATLLASLYDQE